jgi:hypothetical protein
MTGLAIAYVLAALVEKGTGASMCVLTQADFAAAGVHTDAKPKANIDQDGQNVYCVYRGISGAKGGVELDVFYPAGASATDVEQTFKTVMAGDPGAKYEPETVAGASEAAIAPAIGESGYTFAAIDVRRGDLVFSISLPAGSKARSQLVQLSKAVLSRLE